MTIAEHLLAIAEEDIPHTWLDPLLSGPNAVINGYEFTCRDIERLLNAIRERVLSRAASLAAQEQKP